MAQHSIFSGGRQHNRIRGPCAAESSATQHVIGFSERRAMQRFHHGAGENPLRWPRLLASEVLDQVSTDRLALGVCAGAQLRDDWGAVNQRLVSDLNCVRGACDLLEHLEKGLLLAAQHAGHLANAETDDGAQRAVALGPPSAHTIVPAGQNAVSALCEVGMSAGRGQKELHLIRRPRERRAPFCFNRTNFEPRLPSPLEVFQLLEEAASGTRIAVPERSADARGHHGLYVKPLLIEAGTRGTVSAQRRQTDVAKGDRLTRPDGRAVLAQPANDRSQDDKSGRLEWAEPQRDGSEGHSTLVR